MTFTSGVPASGQSLGQTLTPIQNNFTNYFNTISVNHVAPNISGAGKHTFSEFVTQGADPATSVNEITLYGKTTGGATELFIRKDNSGNVYQLTTGTPVNAATGSTFLPGGLLINWGITNSLTPSFNRAFSAPPYSIQVSPSADNAARTVVVSNSSVPTSTGFTVLVSNTGLFYYYIAIGPL